MARILVVEDDEILREGILFALAREGHQVRGAGSLAGMKEQLGQPADLVVLDVSLPDGDSRAAGKQPGACDFPDGKKYGRRYDCGLRCRSG